MQERLQVGDLSSPTIMLKSTMRLAATHLLCQMLALTDLLLGYNRLPFVSI